MLGRVYEFNRTYTFFDYIPKLSNGVLTHSCFFQTKTSLSLCELGIVFSSCWTPYHNDLGYPRLG
nr:MAG TPA: G-protein coupled receptor [Caudoviricetes sp.]